MALCSRSYTVCPQDRDEMAGEDTKQVILHPYMKAVKALQEAMTRIETLQAQNASFEARITALEGALKWTNYL
jgi:hypothetical protein